MKLFSKSASLERKIDEFLDLVSDSGLHFKEGIRYYLSKRFDDFEERLKVVRDLEHRADDLRRDIETQLYTHTLIPESRGDVLGLLENMDYVIDRIKATLLEFSVERPKIPAEFNQDYQELTDYATEAAEAVTSATRAFFRDINAVRDHINKVRFYEKEADKTAEKLKRKAFNTDMELSLKFHLRYFASHIDTIADDAQNVADRLAIYTIKRSM